MRLDYEKRKKKQADEKIKAIDDEKNNMIKRLE